MASWGPAEGAVWGGVPQFLLLLPPHFLCTETCGREAADDVLGGCPDWERTWTETMGSFEFCSDPLLDFLRVW